LTLGRRKQEKKGIKYEYPVHVNHGVGVFKDKLIEVVIEVKRSVRQKLMKELVRLRGIYLLSGIGMPSFKKRLHLTLAAVILVFPVDLPLYGLLFLS
jgi:hypothetical protein